MVSIGSRQTSQKVREKEPSIVCKATRLLRRYECISLFPEHMQTHTDLLCTVHIKHSIKKKKITELPSRALEISSMSEVNVPMQL